MSDFSNEEMYNLDANLNEFDYDNILNNLNQISNEENGKLSTNDLNNQINNLDKKNVNSCNSFIENNVNLVSTFNQISNCGNNLITNLNNIENLDNLDSTHLSKTNLSNNINLNANIFYNKIKPNQLNFSYFTCLDNCFNINNNLKFNNCLNQQLIFKANNNFCSNDINENSLINKNQTLSTNFALKSNSKLLKQQNQNTKLFRCSLCLYSSLDRSKIRRHNVTHTREKPFECELCGSRFTQSGSLKTHLTNIHQINPIEFKCVFCETFFTSNIGELRNHIKYVHKTFYCPVKINPIRLKTINSNENFHANLNLNKHILN